MIRIGRICSGAMLGAAFLLSGCGSSSSQPDLQRLALRLSDFPKATILDTRRTWTNAQAARRDHVAVSLYDRHGRQLSYSEAFERHIMNGSEPTWLLAADTEITRYRNDASAGWGYAHLVASQRHAFVFSANNLGANAGQTQIRAYYHPTSVPRIGDQDSASSVDSGGDEVAFTRRVVIFRHGRYVVWLRVMGLVDNVALWRVVNLARTVDHRIAAAG